MEPQSNARLANRNLKIRTNLKRQFEEEEITLARLMRTMSGLWTKTQAQRKEAAAIRQAAAVLQAQVPQVQDQGANLNVEIRSALRSVTENADNEAPEVRLGRGWGGGAVRGGGGGRGGQGGRGGRGGGRGSGRGRGGRVEGGLRGTCLRCGGDYARSYLWYHSRRCVVEDAAVGGGPGGGAGQEAPDQGEVHEDEGAQADAVRDQGAGAEVEDVHESEDESAEEEEETDDQDILDEVEDMERTVFASPIPRRTRGQKRTAIIIVIIIIIIATKYQISSSSLSSSLPPSSSSLSSSSLSSSSFKSTSVAQTNKKLQTACPRDVSVLRYVKCPQKCCCHV